MTRKKTLALLALALLVQPGCASKSPTETKQAGELGGYVFTYHCSDPSDAFCDVDGGFGTGKFPTLAVGGSFEVTFNRGKENGKDTPEYDLRSFAGTTRMESSRRPLPSGGEVTVLKPIKAGYIALLAEDSTGYGYGDMLHVKAAEVDHIEVTGTLTAAGGSLTASVGGVTVGLSTAAGTVQLRAIPSLVDKTPLAGALPTKWSQVATDVLEINSDATDNVVKCNIKAFGVAKLHVDVGKVGADVTVTLEAKK